MQTLRELWADGQATFGGWLNIPSTSSAEATARVGFDFVCCDNQHGVLDYQATASLIPAILAGGSRPIVRVPWNEPGIIGKMLDAGAEAVIVPMVNSVAEAEAVVRACRYAPVGARSWGPVMAGLRTPNYSGAATTVIPMIETVQAVEHIDEILAVPGIDAVYVGPADLSITLGLAPGNNDGTPAFDEALATIVAACNRAGVVPGIHATGALAARRLEQGFRLITISGDLLAMRTRMAEELAQARGAAGPEKSTAIY